MKNFKPPIDIETASKWASEKVAKMTLEEKANFIGGREAFYSEEIPRLDIPKVLFADASLGLNFRTEFMEFKYDVAIDKSTAMPCTLMLSSTWNKDLAYKYANTIGEECQANATPVLLGPGMNVYRQAQSGRNFEYFGEDPFLISRMIENYIVGLQDTGTIATLKHFIANNTDYFRRKANTIVDERTLHEIYLPGFKAGIEAGAMAVMTSYNPVNGEWTGQSDYIIKNLLKTQLGFQWLVMTDWWSVWDCEKTIKSGQDLEMPGSETTANAAELVKEGKVQESDVDRMCHTILKTFYAMKSFNRKPNQEMIAKIDEHPQTVLDVAREGVVLLKNDNLLPLQNHKNIILTGPYADKIAFGGGAATVKGFDHVALNIAMENEFGENIQYIAKPTDEQLETASSVIVSIGTYDSEFFDRPFELPKEMESLVHRVADLNKNSIVIVNAGSGIKMTNWNDKVAAILYSWYPGQNGNLAIAEILSGKTNPSGKLPITIEKDFSDSPGFGYIPEGEKLYSGNNDDEEARRDMYDIKYDEGIFVGYRWYEKKNIQPLYSFGHGLSYTDFEYSNLYIEASSLSDEIVAKVRFKIKNIGKNASKETAQLYISDPECSADRPIKELKGFAKVELNPNETKVVEIKLTKADFSFFDEKHSKWTAESGEFKILIGSSSIDIHLEKVIDLK